MVSFTVMVRFLFLINSGLSFIQLSTRFRTLLASRHSGHGPEQIKTSRGPISLQIPERRKNVNDRVPAYNVAAKPNLKDPFCRIVGNKLDQGW